MLISKRPIKLAAIVMSLITVAAISAPSAIAASTSNDTAISPQDQAALTDRTGPATSPMTRTSPKWSTTNSTRITHIPSNSGGFHSSDDRNEPAPN